jgi:hypothetical protein
MATWKLWRTEVRLLAMSAAVKDLWASVPFLGLQSPIGVAITIVIAEKVILAALLAFSHFQWLVHGRE